MSSTTDDVAVRSEAVARLLECIDRGAERSDIEAAVDALPSQSGRPDLNGRWKLRWTSEKEVLFLMDKGLLGLPCTGVFQDLNLDAGRLENLVEFSEGHLRVGSTAAWDDESERRVNFKFGSCEARWKDLAVPLPPVGEGWFDTVYCDESVRVARDVRGDTLVSVRDGPTQILGPEEERMGVDAALVILKRAAASRAVPGDTVLAALDALEKGMRTACREDPSIGERQLEALDGAWRLVFTTGTAKTQERSGRINYFPLKAAQEFDTKREPMRISNAIFAGGTPVLQFQGDFEWRLPARRLCFDFDRIRLLGGALDFPLKAGEAAQLGSRSGLGSEGNTKRVEDGKTPFFLWIYADDDIAVARGGGGGLALWKRTERYVRDY